MSWIDKYPYNITYAIADKELTGRCKQRRRVMDATYLERDGDTIVLKYNGEPIVTMYPGGDVVLNKGTSPNIGTRGRMNRCLCSRNMYVNISRGFWYVSPNDYSFQDGMRISSRKVVTGHDPEPLSDKLKRHYAALRERNKLHEVESSGNWSVGDIVIPTWKIYVPGKGYAHVDAGVYQVTRIRAKIGNPWSQRIMLRIEPLSGTNTTTLPYEAARFFSTEWLNSRATWTYSIRKDQFLSAAAQANRTPIADNSIV